MHGAFHGRTTGAVSLSSAKTEFRAGLQPLMAGVFPTPFPYAYRYGWDEDETSRFCLQELDHVLATLTAPNETAAIFAEPILGEGGYVPATARFLTGLRERCDEHGMLLVFDEIQSGAGRTGRFWAHQHFDVEPDLLVTGKGLASGLPLSAIAASEEVMSRGWPGSQGGTFGGNAVSCAAALATLDVIEEEGLVENAREMGDHLSTALEKIVWEQPLIGDLRGRGLMVATELAGDDARDRAKRLVRGAEDRGLLLVTCGPLGNVVRWMPPLIVTREHIDEAVAIFTEAVEEAAEVPAAAALLSE
jgi:4-aminobutyrate aminotransferase-like enzyme